MRRVWKHRKTVETSKKLLIVALVMCFMVTIATIVSVFIIQDTTPLEYLIGGVFALCSTAYGFYYWKAKNENIRKHGGKNYADSTIVDD